MQSQLKSFAFSGCGYLRIKDPKQKPVYTGAKECEHCRTWCEKATLHMPTDTRSNDQLRDVARPCSMRGFLQRRAAHSVQCKTPSF